MISLAFNVEFGHDCELPLMRQKVNSFVTSLNDGETSLMYFTGHGGQEFDA
jgi:hypothetical protein